MPIQYIPPPSEKNIFYLFIKFSLFQSVPSVQIRQELRACAGSTPLTVLKLNMSKFYHLGTLQVHFLFFSFARRYKNRY